MPILYEIDRPEDDIIQHDPAYGWGRTYPDEMGGQGRGFLADATLIDDWYDLTGGTWTAFDADGTTTNAPTVSQATSGSRRGGSDETTSVAWNGSGADSQYCIFALGESVVLEDFNFLGFWITTDAAISAGELTVGVYNTDGTLIGSAMSGAAISVTSIWQWMELDWRPNRDAATGEAIGTIRITHSGSSDGDTTLIERLTGYWLSNGHGPPMGHFARFRADGAEARGVLQSMNSAQPGQLTTAAANDETAVGPIIEGYGSTYDPNDIFAAPAAAGDYGWVQVDGFAYLRSGGTITAGDKLAVASSTTVDADLIPARHFAVALEDGGTGADILCRIGVGQSAPASGGAAAIYNTIAFGNTTAKTLGTIPANSDILDVTVHVTALFDSSGTDVIDVGWTANDDALVEDLDVSALGSARTGDAAEMPVGGLGDVGSTDLPILGIFKQSVADAAAGSATVIITYITP